MSKENVEKKMGQKYKIKYSDIYPLYVFTDKDSVSPLVEKYLKELGDQTAIIKYKEEGLYEDLATGKTIIDNNERTDVEDIKYMMAFESEPEETEDFLNLKTEEIKKINYYYSLAELMQVEGLLQNSKVKGNARKKVKEYREKLNVERIGRLYAIKYSDIKLTLLDNKTYSNDFKDYFSKNSNPKYYGNSYTIIEYIGDDMYRDLSTGLLISEHKIAPSFKTDGSRIDYSKIEYEDYLLEYPVRIDIKSLKPLDEEILYEIGKYTIPNIKEIIKNITKTISEIRKEYQLKFQILKEEEKERQIENAEAEYERHETITKVKTYYKIK